MKERVKKVVSDTLGCPITDQSSQENTEQWDSLRHLNLVIALEMEFDTDFEPEQIAQMKSIDAIVSLMEAKNQ